MMSDSDPSNASLLALLRTLSFARRRVVLASGKESDFFIDCKQAVLTAEGHACAGEALWRILPLFGECQAVAGVELGGCPLASAVSLLSSQKKCPLDALYVRKTAKDHGSKRRVEGGGALPQHARVVVLEDVLTTGMSSLRAVKTLQEEGYHVLGIAALVDRQEGAQEALAQEGLQVHALFTRNDFL